MEREEKHSSSGYGRPPWVFKGRALYQLHLVKAETARAFIPKELRLVEAFGYTLGGFFLASYDDSPPGTFDEVLVVIAGLVRDRPASYCAWAASVLVNSSEACTHGRKEFGLPSQVARFSKTIRAIPKTPKRSGFLDMVGAFTSYGPRSCMDVQVSEFKGQTPIEICNIKFSPAELDSSKWMGPPLKISLPSFSGLTEYNPQLLKYSCQIECRVRVVPPAKVSGPPAVDLEEEKSSGCETSVCNFKRNLCLSEMLSKPILALEFNCLKMKVEAPTVVTQHSKNSLKY